MRIRDNTTIRPIQQDSYALYPNGHRVTNSAIVSIPLKDVMHDEVIKGFARKSNDGEVFVNPMERLKTVGDAPLCPYWQQRQIGPSIWYSYNPIQGYVGVNDQPWAESPVLKEIVRNEALAVTEAYAKVGAADLETLTELAELKETLSFMASPVKKMAAVTRRVSDYVSRRKRWEDAFAQRLERWNKRNPKHRGPQPVKSQGPRAKIGRIEATDIPSAWLAYRYAIMPLIYSFQDLQEHLSRAIYPERVTSRAKESSDVSLVTSPPWTIAGGTEFGSIQYRHSRSGNAKVTSWAGVLYVADWSLQRQLGIQLHRIPATMYEVIPLSFVADWFHNGMDVYNALTASLRSQEILGAWVTTKVEYDFVYNLAAEPLDPQSTCYPGSTCYVGSGTWTRRKPVSLADVKFKFRTELNAKRIVDALALSSTLLATAMKRGKAR